MDLWMFKFRKFRGTTSHFLFSCEMKISMELARSCCRPKPRPSLRSILRSFIGLWVKIWHRNKTACSESNPVQRSRSKSTTWESAQIWIKQHSDFRWRRAKAWKRCQAWFWIDSNQSLQRNRLQMKCDVWKPCSDQRWQDQLWFSTRIWIFF